MEKEDRVRKLLSITAEHMTNVFRIIVTQAIAQSQLTNSTIMWKYTCRNPTAIWDRCYYHGTILKKRAV